MGHNTPASQKAPETIMHNNIQMLVSFAAVGLMLAMPSVAKADLEACGGVYLSADAKCELVPKETCTTRCEDVAMETSCAGARWPTPGVKGGARRAATTEP